MLLGHQLWPCYPSAYGNHFDTLLAVVRACEQASLDSVWMPDHLMFQDKEHPEKETPVMAGPFRRCASAWSCLRRPCRSSSVC